MKTGIMKRFALLWREFGTSKNPRPQFADLVSRYTEPWRAYHTLDHIKAVLGELDMFRASEEVRGVDLKVVEMAIWYHDIVYNTKADDNEERSVDIFRRAVVQLACPSDDFERNVANAILATKHRTVQTDLNIRVMCDVDLAILGHPRTAFDEYEWGIRREYVWVPEARFCEERLAILESFLRRKHLYSTRFFREKYEARARENLERSIENFRLSVPRASLYDDEGGGLFSKSPTSTGSGGFFSRD